ncbi:uncharacterized protein TRIADDRAFT_21281, partial [Trichoplax adhaerens]
LDQQLEEIKKETGLLTIDGKKYKIGLDDLQVMGQIGSGTCGTVYAMEHAATRSVIAVKKIPRIQNEEEKKRVLMDLQVVMKSHDCPYIVKCFGLLIAESDILICMEKMSTCLCKLLTRTGQPIPEDILGKITVAVVKALHYLKQNHGVIHRDVKPSNILLDADGNVKLCDFGISGRLVDSKARTRGKGCAAYMSPERIDPSNPTGTYDIRADVWSLGISLVELATGKFPYDECEGEFQVLTRILQDDPPKLPSNGQFSQEFCSFVEKCLIKDHDRRPKYAELLQHKFIQIYETKDVDVASWFNQLIEETSGDCGVNLFDV